VSTSSKQDKSALIERLRDATELLESLVADRRPLDTVPVDEAKRFLKAVARVHNPDRLGRRMQDARRRLQKSERIKQDDGVLHETGIRTLRRKPVFTTPNVFPPESFEPQDVHDYVRSPQVGASTELRHCYVCKQKYTTIHHFYDQMCPDCA
jgi:hypothetical protein